MLFHFSNKALGRFESREIVCFNNQCSILGNISSSLLGTMLNGESAESAKEDILFSLCHTLAYFLHKRFYSGCNVSFCKTSVLNNLVDNICFCHLDSYLLNVYLLFFFLFGLQRY